MMKELKRGIKLTKYGYGFKTYAIIGIFIVLSGLIMSVGAGIVDYGEHGSVWSPGILFLVLGPQMLMQVSYSLLYSGIALSSPGRRTLDIFYPNFLTIVSSLVGDIVVIVVAGIKVMNHPDSRQSTIEGMLLTGVLIVIVQLYGSLAYKYFWLSYSGFMAGFFLGMDVASAIVEKLNVQMGFAEAAVLCSVLVAVGTLLSCLLRRALYKKQLSPMAAGAALRKALQ